MKFHQHSLNGKCRFDFPARFANVQPASAPHWQCFHCWLARRFGKPQCANCRALLLSVESFLRSFCQSHHTPNWCAKSGVADRLRESHLRPPAYFWHKCQQDLPHHFPNRGWLLRRHRHNRSKNVSTLRLVWQLPQPIFARLPR